MLVRGSENSASKASRSPTAKSSLADVVTAADREAEALITQALRKARPNHGLLGEEGASVEGTTGITWAISIPSMAPHTSMTCPSYAVSIAATGRGRRPGTTFDGRREVAGAVYVPALDELFEAHEFGGHV